MDIWIIRNGDKSGPIHDYEVRHQIEAGDLAPTTPAWHEGLDSWRPLVEIDLFRKEFSPKVTGETAPATATEPPPLPVKDAVFRRFWARWFDLQTYVGLWWFGMWVAGQDIEAALQSGWLMVFQLVPWFILEAILIHRFGTTPGKWLLGLRVANADGSPLGLAASAKRAVRVLILGIGFGWSVLTLFCQALSFFTVKRIGNTLWDYSGGHRVQTSPIILWRVSALALLFLAAGQLRSIVVTRYQFPEMIEEIREVFPAFAEEMKRNPPWSLPERGK